MVFKLIAVGLMVLCGLVSFTIQYFIPERNYKNNERRIKIITRVRTVCFLIMLVLLFICIII